MSRVLPAHANLDHLRNQAKHLLRELQQQKPSAKLADAQHAIAREYGFASWPKLKAHVESRRRPAETAAVPASEPSRGGTGAGGGGATAIAVDEPPNYGFQRYTPKAREATFFSRFEAGQDGSATIDPEHVLLGLIRAAKGLASGIFERVNLSVDDARAASTATRAAREPLLHSVHIPFGPEARRILRHAVDEADGLRHQNIGLAHLLLGILHDERSVAASILLEKGMNLDAVRNDVVMLLNEQPA